MKKTFLLLFSLNGILFAQYDQQARNAFIHPDINESFDYWNIIRPDVRFHSSFKPYISSTFSFATDSVVPFKFYAFKNYFLSKTFNEKPQRRNWFNLQLHPIVDAQIGYDPLLNRMLPEYIGGMHFKTNINNDFTFAASVFGGKTSLPFFLDTAVSPHKILPTYGQAYGNNKTGYQFFDFTGYTSYSPNNNKIINLQVGRDKHFIGDGYRSLLLSDVAPAYPFFRINTNIWHFQYNVWYTWMYDVSKSDGFKNKLQNKFATFHYLSYNITQDLNLGLFENIVWRGSDSNQTRGFDVNYLNPIIFFRPVEYSVGSPDNAFIGLNMSYKFLNCMKVYGQLGLDEFNLYHIQNHRGWWGNKQAWQLGAKYINAFNLKGLSLQAEYNAIRPYTYSHGLVEQNYSHFGVPLAHPYGANLREGVVIINYRKNNWQLSGKAMYVNVGKDTINSKVNMGQNIFLSYTTRPYEEGHKITQGVKNDIYQFDLKFTYFIIPDMNLRAEFGFIQRAQKNDEGSVIQNPFIYFGIKSSFWNNYKDY